MLIPEHCLLSPTQAEAEEDCHPDDAVRAGDDDENERPAETDLQACFFICVFLILLLSIHKQELVIIMKIHRFLFALNVAVCSYRVLEYFSYTYVVDFFFSEKEYQ